MNTSFTVKIPCGARRDPRRARAAAAARRGGHQLQVAARRAPARISAARARAGRRDTQLLAQQQVQTLDRARQARQRR
jgi:hypothetical protein